MVKKPFFVILFLIPFFLLSQKKDSLRVETTVKISKYELKKAKRLKRREAREIRNIRPYNALAPSKAAFYSAVLPGLGQAYTGKYWKIPIVYGALGTGVGIALWNRRNYNEVRDIYKNRLRGITNDKFFDQVNNRAIISDNGLIEAQRNFKKQQELSILITGILYVLNIVDANVTAHLQQYNMSKDLSVAPNVYNDEFTGAPKMGLSLKYNF